MFTPDSERLYPLGIGLDELNIIITIPLDQLIEIVKNDLKEGKL